MLSASARSILKHIPQLERRVRRVLLMKRQITNVNRYGTLRRRPLLAARHVLGDRELVNFTYEIDNTSELIDVIALALSEPYERLVTYANELESDMRLLDAINLQLSRRSDRNKSAPYGRRLGWYLAARTVRPRFVVETGTHDGLGSAVILSALARNAHDGASGRLVSVDLDPAAGWLVPDYLRRSYEQRFSDSLVTLAECPEPIDMAIFDSTHTYEHESAELQLVAQRASADAVIVSDNPGSRAFTDFCAARGLTWQIFTERPRRHFYPGASLGIARLPATDSQLPS